MWALIAWINYETKCSAARSRARIEIDSLRAVHCTPEDAEEFYEASSHRFENELESSPLGFEEKEMLEVGFANAMELAGCGYNARAEGRRKEEEGHQKKFAHRDGTVDVYAWGHGGTGRIWIDGDLIGDAPFETSLPAGKHSIKAVWGDRVLEDSFQLAPGETKRIELDPAKARPTAPP